ncbi:InlB B-repeat-containing protein [Olsenella intestinalis]|uniref:InlB B-repeat-containing protein n=1 Tax=Olsenella intestinalis TaxID=2930083 RepID=UPI00200EBFCD|nr:InlB B-repeat-containing protein [Olsenella intestinalis]
MRQTTTRKALCVLFSITLAAGLCPAPARGTNDAGQGVTDPSATADGASTAQETNDTQAPDDPQATNDAADQQDATTEKSVDAAPLRDDLEPTPALDPSPDTEPEPAPDPLQNLTPQGETGPSNDLAPQEELEAASDLTPQAAEIVDGESATISRTSGAWSSSAGGTQYQITFADQGVYTISLTGAEGGGSSGAAAGGTTIGAVTFAANTVAYAVTGGAGENPADLTPTGTPGSGGANGGGAGGSGSRYVTDRQMKNGGGGGGGATHIAIAPRSLVEVLSSGDANVIMVAGGGGGCSGTIQGGSGGGATGGNGINITSGETVPASGTQSSGHARGQGGTGGNGNGRGQGSEGRGGGGGGYYGGKAVSTTHNASGAGGSGFLNESFFSRGTKSADGGDIEKDGSWVANTHMGGGTGDGTASVSYLASIVNLDSKAAVPGTDMLFSAPLVDTYYTAYSIDGLEGATDKIELPQMDGWKFKGYYTQPDGQGTRYVEEDGRIVDGLYGEGSTTLYALWWPVVHFDANGVTTTSFPADLDVETGTSADEPTRPAATGTTFKGWSTNKSTYQEYDFSHPVTEPLTLYAFWTPHVEFVMHGHAQEIAPQFLQSGQAATEPEAPTETGYTFEGWYTDPGFAPEARYDFSKPVTSDVTLHAKWSANEYTIEFVDDGRVAGTEDFVYNDAEKPLRTASDLGLSREGWTFAGWRSTGALQVDYADGEEVRNLSTETGTLEFNAVWERDVTFHQASAADLLNTLSPAAEASASQATAVQQLTDGASYSSVTAPLLETVGSWTPMGWSADTAATTMSDVTPGAAFTPMTTEFYGLYRRTIRLAFDGSGAESGEVEDMTEAQHMNASGELTSATFELPANAFEYAGHSFRAWDLGAPGDAVTLKPAAAESPNVTVHALWDELPAAAGTSQSEDAPGARRGATPKTSDPTLPYAGGTAALALLAMGIGAWRRRRSQR